MFHQSIPRYAVLLTPNTIAEIKSGEQDFSQLIAKCKRVVLQLPINSERNKTLLAKYPGITKKICYIPVLNFQAYHPDMSYVYQKTGQLIDGFCGPYHSNLILYAYKHNFDKQQTIELFNRDVFDYLNYFDYWKVSANFIINQEKITNIPLANLLRRWKNNGCFMYSINHPKKIVFSDLINAFFEREKLDFIYDAVWHVEDTLADGAAWGVYPLIADQLGIDGRYFFKKNRTDSKKIESVGLEEFVAASFESFSKYDLDQIVCNTLGLDKFKKLGTFLKERKSCFVAISSQISLTQQASNLSKDIVSKERVNPYQTLPDYQFWRRAVERSVQPEIDPVVRSRFKLKRSDKVATAGSCFAQHISRTLSKNRFSYYIVEKGVGLSAQAAIERNFGVYSARYGNLYTARQLLQLFDRAYSHFSPVERSWMRDDGFFVDPFRPQIEPDGFASIEELERSQEEHLGHVRTMFEKLDIFVFTLGLTEAWRSKIDGAVFPLAPGVVAGSMDDSRYEFVNFETDEIISDMQTFIGKLMIVNSSAKIILTVSPVPLIATYEDRHVLVSTTYSKSALRAAADTLVRHNSQCDYFPSYEIITGSYTRGVFFENDLRSIKEDGIGFVMQLFMKHYFDENDINVNTLVTNSAQKSEKFELELMREAELNAQIICDEEVLDSDPGQCP